VPSGRCHLGVMASEGVPFPAEPVFRSRGKLSGSLHTCGAVSITIPDVCRMFRALQARASTTAADLSRFGIPGIESLTGGVPSVIDLL
jgi:hypothetical protein